MSNGQHTPGPWEFRKQSEWSIHADGATIMCDLQYYPWVPSKEADWHLIASAPDLLDVVEHIMRCIPPGGFAQIHYESSTWAQMLAAIAKAKGQDHV